MDTPHDKQEALSERARLNIPWDQEIQPHTTVSLITRTAPSWAWDIIDETLTMDTQSSAFDKNLRDDIEKAIDAMT